MPDRVTESITVQGSVEDIYRKWADFEIFPSFMKYIKSVRKTGGRTSHWIMEGPAGTLLAWDAETTTMEENKRIAWKSTGGDIKTSGQVTFNSLDNNQTMLTVTMQYVPPSGRAGEMVAHWFVNPEERLRKDLRNFKAYVEGMHDRIQAD
jgi:uncharacterized membrane protein